MADAPDYDHDAADTDELPLFANDEAKHVFAQIELQRKALEKAAVEHAEHLERLKVMAEHLKNVQQEVSHTTSLATSKTAAIKTEAHGIALFQREAGRYRQELKREQGALELHDAQLQVLQNGVFEANERMDRFKIEMNWNQEELEQWALASKQKEDDDAALQRYTRADEAKVGSLALNIEKLSKLALAKQIACDAEKTETAARQIELERTADEFRALHAERSRLLRQWQDAIDAASRRDRDIGDVAGAYLEERKVKEAKLVQMNDERAALKAAQDATADLESRALLSERQVQMRREDVQREKAQLQTMQDDMDVLKSELASSARAVLRVRSENERSAEEVARRGATLDGARAAYHVSKQQFDFVTAGSGAVENEATAAELFLREAEAAKLSSLRQLAGLKANMFKASQNLFALRQAEANFIAEIGGASAQQRNLAAKVRQLDGESAKQTELVYNAEFQIQQMERKVARGMGERTDEEKHHLAAQILKLEAALVVKREERKMLVGQSRRLANELRAAKRRGEDAVNDEQTARARIQEMELENTSAEQSLVQKKAKEAEALVASDMSRLELRRLREALGQRADVVFTLENRKQQLSLSMAERQREIGVHTAVQAAQLRHANEDRHQAKMELGKRKHHAHTLAAKYDVLVKSSKLRVGDEEPQSQAFYLIQAAQQRAELQRAGDDLDSAIRKREREMRALEATLAHVNARNTTYRDSFKKAAPQSADADDLAQLEEQEKLAKDALFRRKKALQRLATDHEEDARRLAQVDEQCLRLRERNGHLREAEAQMALELQAHDAALAQLGDRVAQLAQLHREALGTSAETVQERLFAAEAAEESNASVLATLHELSRAYPEIDDSLAGILAGLRPANA